MLLCMVPIVFAAQGDEVIYIEPYTENHTPDWAYDTQRFAIITFGSIPFTMLATTLTYSMYRYCANGFDSNYIPNPFPTSSEASKLTKNEQIGVLATGASLGLVIGITDLIVNKVKENKERKELQKEKEETITITTSRDQGSED